MCINFILSNFVPWGNTFLCNFLLIIFVDNLVRWFIFVFVLFLSHVEFEVHFAVLIFILLMIFVDGIFRHVLFRRSMDRWLLLMMIAYGLISIVEVIILTEGYVEILFQLFLHNTNMFQRMESLQQLSSWDRINKIVLVL